MNERVVSIDNNRELHSMERSNRSFQRMFNLLGAFFKMIRSGHFILVVIEVEKERGTKTEMQVSGINKKGAVSILTEALEGLMLDINNDKLREEQMKKPSLPGKLSDEGPEDFLNRIKKELN